MEFQTYAALCFRHGVLDDTPNDYYHVAKMMFRYAKVDGTDWT